MKRQSKKDSLCEAIQNVIVGAGIAFISQCAIFPIMGIKASVTDNLILTGYFTVISVCRSYWLRRFNEWKLVNNFRFFDILSYIGKGLTSKEEVIYKSEMFLD